MKSDEAAAERRLDWDAYRSQLLSLAEPSKTEFLLERCAGKRVLDLGCIDHSVETAIELGNDWQHAAIAGVASEVVGVDLLAGAAAELSARGFDIRLGDVERFDLGETFDVVVAGDLIEHLSNIGNFLDAVTRHMHDQSVCIITTPNPFNIEQAMNGVFRNKTLVNDEHTVAIDPKAMFQLVERSPLQIVDFSWIDTRFHFPLQRVVARHVINPLMRLAMRHRPLVRRDYAVVLMRR